MASQWMIPETPGDALSLEDLAHKVSSGQISDSTWVVSCQLGSRVQVFDIPGVDRALRRIRERERDGRDDSGEASSHAVKRSSARIVPPKAVHAPLHAWTIFDVCRLVLSTRPHLLYFVASMCTAVASVYCWYHSRTEMLRFPRAWSKIKVEALPFWGDVPKTDFWLIVSCLLLTSVATFQLSILYGRRIR